MPVFSVILYSLLALLALLVLPFALRIVFYVCAWLFILFSGLCFFRKKYEKPSRFSYSLLTFGYWLICSCGRVKIHSKGTELVPSDTCFLFVSNHRSRFDNMIHVVSMKKSKIVFVSKEENFKIPLAGRFMRRNCYICLKRGNSKSAFEMVDIAASRIENKVASVGIFPEGMRSRRGGLLPFKPGVFKIAEKAKCPIVVGVTKNTEMIHKNWPWKRTDVYFEVIKVCNPEDFEGKTTGEISGEIENLVRSSLASSSLPS